MLRVAIVAVLLTGLLMQPVLGDVVFLQDGQQVEGKILNINDRNLVLETERSDGTGALEMRIPKSDVSLALYAVNESALAQAGDALLRARNFFFIGLGVQVVSALVTPLFGATGGLVAVGATIVGGALQLIAVWNVGTAGAYLVQASR